MRTAPLALPALLACLILAAVPAQARKATSTPLQMVDVLHCEYTLGASPQYGDDAVTGALDKIDNYVVEVRDIDRQAKTATVFSNKGSNKAEMVSTRGGLFFLERTEAGSVHVLAVQDAKKGGPRYKSVYSRHTLDRLGQFFLPSQYYGFCAIKE